MSWGKEIKYESCQVFYRFFATSLQLESYMSIHVLLKLVNELGKRDKMQGLPSILSLFRSKFNKLNDTGHGCWILFIILH